MFCLTVGLTVGGAAPAALGAQRQVDPGVLVVDTGAVVRVGLTDGVRRTPFERPVRRVRGTVRVIAPDTLYLARPDTAGVTPVPRALIQGVELRLGPPTRLGTAKTFAVNGLALGLLAGYAAAGDGRDGQLPPTRRLVRSLGIGTGLGLGVGAVLGFVHPRERWRVAWLPE